MLFLKLATQAIAVTTLCHASPVLPPPDLTWAELGLFDHSPELGDAFWETTAERRLLDLMAIQPQPHFLTIDQARLVERIAYRDPDAHVREAAQQILAFPPSETRAQVRMLLAEPDFDPATAVIRPEEDLPMANHASIDFDEVIRERARETYERFRDFPAIGYHRFSHQSLRLYAVNSIPGSMSTVPVQDALLGILATDSDPEVREAALGKLHTLDKTPPWALYYTPGTSEAGDLALDYQQQNAKLTPPQLGLLVKLARLTQGAVETDMARMVLKYPPSPEKASLRELLLEGGIKGELAYAPSALELLRQIAEGDLDPAMRAKAAEEIYQHRDYPELGYRRADSPRQRGLVLSRLNPRALSVDQLAALSGVLETDISPIVRETARSHLELARQAAQSLGRRQGFFSLCSELLRGRKL